MHDTTQVSVSPPRFGAVRGLDVAIALFGGGLVSLAVPAGLAFVAYAAAMLLHYPFPDAAGLIAIFRKSSLLNIATLLVSDAALLAVVWLVARRRYPHPVAQYFSPLNARLLALTASSGLAISFLFEAINMLLEQWGIAKFQITDFERALVPHAPVQAALAIFGAVLFAPFVEEFLFRGLLLDWLQRRLGRISAVLSSSMVFALVHGLMLIHPGMQGWIDTLEIGVVGAVMACWVIGTASLQSSLAVHAAFNAVSMLIGFLSP